MKNFLPTFTLNRTSIMFALIVVWLFCVFSLRYLYQQQVSNYQQTINEQISQRVSMTSLLQSKLIDKEFSFLASNLKQLSSLTVEAPEQVSDFSERLKNLNPTIWHIYITDATGDITFSTKDGYQPSMKERNYFIEHTNNDEMNIFIASPQQTIIQESALYIAMSYPIQNAEGQFIGIVVATLKSDDLNSQLGDITSNQNISAMLTDQSGRLIWSSITAESQQHGDIYSLCKDHEYQTATELGIHRVHLKNNAQCDVRFLEKWGMYSIVAENRNTAEQAIQQYEQQLAQRNIIILLVFTLLLLFLGRELLKQIDSRQLLAMLHRRNKAIIDAMPDMLLTMKADGTMIDHEFQEDFPLVGLSDRINGSNMSEYLQPELVEKKLKLIAETLSTGKPSTLEWPYTINGKEFYFLERITALDDNHVLAFIVDITSRREAERLLEWQAYHDGLTDLANRLMFFEFLN